jgi:hypothetical protein
MTRALVFALALLLPCSAHAQHMTADEFVAMCDVRDQEARFYCSMYILGIRDGYHVASGLARGAPVMCTPEGTTPEEALGIALNYIRVRAAKAGTLPASMLISVALFRAWPCEGGRP